MFVILVVILVVIIVAIDIMLVIVVIIVIDVMVAKPTPLLYFSKLLFKQGGRWGAARAPVTRSL